MKNKNMRALLMVALTSLLFSSAVQEARSVEIVEIYEPGAMPATYSGTGNFTNICHAACLVAKLAHPETGRLVAHFQLSPVGGGAHSLIIQGGNPNREIEAWIYINNDANPGHFSWYFDPNPLDCPSTNFVSYTSDLGTGPINSTRCFTGVPTSGRMDVFTAVMHELVWHAFGMSTANQTFLGDVGQGTTITIMAPWMYAGTVLPFQSNNSGVVAHLTYFSYRSLGAGSYGVGERVYPSAVDIAGCGYVCRFGCPLNVDLVPAAWLGAPFNNNGQTMRTVSWIQPLGGTWNVQQSNDLKTWTTLNTAPAVTNGVYSINVICTNGAGFYRMTGHHASFVTSPSSSLAKSLLAPSTSVMTLGCVKKKE